MGWGGGIRLRDKWCSGIVGHLQRIGQQCGVVVQSFEDKRLKYPSELWIETVSSSYCKNHYTNRSD